MKFINLCYGQQYFKGKDWVNIYFTFTDREAKTGNLLKCFPFTNNHADVESDGMVYKPDSLFMEAPK